MSRTCVDIFSGAAGGWTLGMHRAGVRTVAACELDPWRRATFHNRWGIPVYDDVRTLTAARLAADGIATPWLLCGSPPCKEYSSANSRGRGLDGDDLFLHAARLADELRPSWVAFENSPGVRTKGYDRIAGEMEDVGYALWPLVVGAANAGAAHRRGWVWIIGLRRDVLSDPAGAQGRTAGQSRGPVGVGPHADSVERIFQRGQYRDVPDTQEITDDRDIHRGIPANASSADREERGGGIGRRRLWRQKDDGAHPRLPPPHAHGDGLRIKQGRRVGADGQVAPIAFDPGGVLGPVGSVSLGEHFRKLAGVPARLAERCRSAYGDAVVPILPELIGRALIAWEENAGT